jgi:hypothetical protein
MEKGKKEKKVPSLWNNFRLPYNKTEDCAIS